MTDIFDFRQGNTPLLISIPHDGRRLAHGQAEQMSDAGRALPDTDWHVRELYSFAAELGASVIAANYSRYVVDLNRPSTDEALYEGQMATGVCPCVTFAGEDIYVDAGLPTEADRQQRIADYWMPYHDKIAVTIDSFRARFGYALLWDAHSIAAEVPTLFEGSLPDLNIGTNDGRSCATRIVTAVADVAKRSSYSSVIDGRFKGGYITRYHGRPDDDIHAMQLELTQRNYMDEKNLSYDAGRADKLIETIKDMLAAFEGAAGEGA
ncbi:MAG: N-formylglutamate deformylase [Woeseiaceae bacterium]|nr:N-formylglutamate deformylase [Woeseiaceae bacterium]